jgi:hypothetical protein
MGAAQPGQIKRLANGAYAYNLRDNDELFQDALEDIKSSPEVRQFMDEVWDERADEAMRQLWIKTTTCAVHRTPLSGIGTIAAPHITSEQLRSTLRLMLQTGTFNHLRIAEPKPEPDTRPRDAQGRFLTEAQVREREYVEYSNTHSSRDCQERARADAGYNRWRAGQHVAEMNDDAVETVIPAGLPTKSVKSYPELVEFARRYNEASRESIRPRSGMVHLAGEQIDYRTFLELVDHAANAGLL